jgi:Spy/CpxP family protein refolding chaperone
MFHGFLFGVIGGIAAAKLWKSCRHGGCGSWRDMRGGGCGPSGSGLGGRFVFFRLIHELHLTPEQWQQGHEILHELRGNFQKGREDLRSSLGPLLSILAASEFDAKKAEEVAHQHDDAFGRVRANALSALERFHRILTPEQRLRLQRFIAEEQYRR